jgi:GNAT superfamily N-acetyltransferase
MMAVEGGQLAAGTHCVVRQCSIAELFDDPDSAALFVEYEKECANLLLGETAAHRLAYEALERTGYQWSFGAYVDGKLRGFGVLLVAVVPHYGKCHGTVESIFVAREERSSGLGPSLMRVMEDCAKRAGCGAIFYSAPVGSKLARLLFLSADLYTNTAHVFTRRLQ